MSGTYEGSIHDKKIAEGENLSFDKVITLLQDSGFQGYQPANAVTVMPEKASKLHPLTEEQKKNNTKKAKERVYVENSIRGLKTFRVAKETIRTHLEHTRDLVMFIACGLANFLLNIRYSQRYNYST